MQWLVTIFESTSDQARLATTIIAAIIAIAVVLLNQLFNARRARKEKLVGKVEEIYSALIKMQLLKSAIHNEVVTGYPKKRKSSHPGISYGVQLEHEKKEAEWSRKIDGMRDEFSGLGSTAFMLTGLYFPYLKKDVTDIWTCFDSLYFSYAESEILSDYTDVAKDHIDKLNKLFIKTFEKLSCVMKNTMH
jgi:hypothetical protein